MSNPLFEIPEFEAITEILKCRKCSLASNCQRHRNYVMAEAGYSTTGTKEEFLGSRYDCEKFVRLVSSIKLSIEFILLAVSIAFLILHFHVFWKTVFYSAIIFIIILFFDMFSDKMIYKHCVKSEQKRINEYNEKVERLKKENEAIERANLGITEEVQKFLDDSNNILNKLTNIYTSIKKCDILETKEGERVLKKLEGVNLELEVLNNKLSKDNFETSYISTLYKVHLPKLLEYTKRFVELLNLETISQNQIIKFADLLEVFRIKIANHTQYLQDKAEDDFIIKITALNEDVMPEFDGSEVESNE